MQVTLYCQSFSLCVQYSLLSKFSVHRHKLSKYLIKTMLMACSLGDLSNAPVTVRLRDGGRRIERLRRTACNTCCYCVTTGSDVVTLACVMRGCRGN